MCEWQTLNSCCKISWTGVCVHETIASRVCQTLCVEDDAKQSPRTRAATTTTTRSKSTPRGRHLKWRLGPFISWVGLLRIGPFTHTRAQDGKNLQMWYAHLLTITNTYYKRTCRIRSMLFKIVHLDRSKWMRHHQTTKSIAALVSHKFSGKFTARQ